MSTIHPGPALLGRKLAEHARALGERGPDWLRHLRRTGLARCESVGWPTTRDEAWRSTNLGALVSTDFDLPAQAPVPDLSTLPPETVPELGGARLVFVDGRFAPEHSTPHDAGGLSVLSLGRLLAEQPDRLRPWLERRDPATHPCFEALNIALFEDGALVLAATGSDEARPVHLLFLTRPGTRPTAANPRIVVVAEPGSRLCVVETHAALPGADAPYFVNPVTDLHTGDNARLEHYRIQLEGPRAFHVSAVHARQGRDSSCLLLNVDLGGRLVRHEVACVLEGEGAQARLDGLYATRGDQHVDNYTVLEHASPHGSSREVYKGILDERSRTVFNGRIIVRPGAQKTDAKQSNPNLLLSGAALARTRPQLEIYADDVKCTHGATIGRLDEDAVFYLRSRGLDELDARHLMIAAFADEVLTGVGPEGLRAALRAAVATRLPRTGA
jgi:Fe-S cluster assembly protein SufD